ERQLFFRQQWRDPDVLLINPIEWFDVGGVTKSEKNIIRRLTLNSSDVVKPLNLCPPPEDVHISNVAKYPCFDLICGSCDGMICYYNDYNRICVVNPTTRWSRSVPLARFQAVYVDMLRRNSWKGEDYSSTTTWDLGLGKDKFTNTYKLVWLYNSFELGLENVTTCEVFDFSTTNTWRYVTAAPCRIVYYKTPLYFDGSLHWFTDDYIMETKILSFDLHTEKFRVIAKAPFVEATYKQIIMCNLNNRLCVSQKKWPRQEIWSLDKSDMTWEKIYSLDLPTNSHWFSPDCVARVIPCVIPLMVIKDNNALLLFDARGDHPSLVIYDPELKSYDLYFTLDYRSHILLRTAISCTQSLISIV
ncbi:hypothetical protein EUTSA_v10021927mg, partial [Eutrema salsugineum]